MLTVHPLPTRQVRRLVADIILVLVAFIGALAPFIHELVPDNISEHHATSVAVAQAVVMKKLLTAAGTVFVVFLVALRRRKGSVAKRLAALPLVRVALLTGATIATALASFDACTAYHAIGLDTTGSCLCWLTGAFAGAGALLSAIICLTGRTWAEVMRDVARGLIRLFIVLDRIFRTAVERFTHVQRLRMASGSRLARRIAGRAPPTFE